MKNTTKDKERAFVQFLVLLVALTVAIWVRDAGASDVEIEFIGSPAGTHYVLQSADRLAWSGPIAIYHNSTGSVVTDAQVAGAIQYAAWSWSQRTGRTITYGGLTTQEAIPGAAVLSWLDELGMFLEREKLGVNGFVRLWVRLDTGDIARASLVLNSNRWKNWPNTCAAATLVHEVGHAIGINTHSPDNDDVMFATSGLCRFAPSAADVRMTAYSHNVCHGELMPTGEVYLPGIAGFGVTLAPSPDGLWRVVAAHDSGEHCTGVVGGLIYIHDVRGFDSQFRNVVLEPVGDGFRVLP